MSKKLYCQVNGKKREVIRNLILPFPEGLREGLEPPYPKDSPAMIEGRIVMKANISIAILAEEERLSWDVWVSVSQDAVRESFYVKERRPKENIISMEGILESSLPFHSKTSGLQISLVRVTT